ncbi:hypothetical protein LDENG_00163640 [Lucifuga dentata]|nr:hypothetical protein LDENG_00163640 [Lucifuga dentata]
MGAWRRNRSASPHSASTHRHREITERDGKAKRSIFTYRGYKNSRCRLEGVTVGRILSAGRRASEVLGYQREAGRRRRLLFVFTAEGDWRREKQDAQTN